MTVLLTATRNAFPDACFTTLELTTEGDKVTNRWEATGTHKGAFMGIHATNKKGTRSGTTTYTIAE